MEKDLVMTLGVATTRINMARWQVPVEEEEEEEEAMAEKAEERDELGDLEMMTRERVWSDSARA